MLTCIVAWWNIEALKGILLDVDQQVYAFDSRNLSAELATSGVYAGHLVTVSLRWRNGQAMVEVAMHPSRDEVANWGEQLRVVYERNAMERALAHASRQTFNQNRR